MLEKTEPPDFDKPDEPHGILADLPLPIYITTNYDDFMYQALKRRKRNPVREFCRWYEHLENQPSIFDSDFEPTVENPVVFHLHGHINVVESMVLTEDDYIDFLMAISRNPRILPARIEAAFTSTSLLFMGYRLADWDFRGLFRSLVSYINRSIKRSHISVQLLPLGEEVSEHDKNSAQKYFDEYFKQQYIRVYWGTCQEFVDDLRNRWEAYNRDK